MPRELSKCRNWEKERRNRLKDCFKNLEQVLPCYNPSVSLNKTEILTNAATYIQELQDKLKNALTADADKKPEHEEIKQLYAHVKQLLSRNAQLSDLLKDAHITIPKESGTIKSFVWTKWSNVISPEKASMIAKQESQKENEPRKIKRKCTPKKKPVQKKPLLKQKFKKGSKKAALVQKNSRRIIISGANLNPIQNMVSVPNVQPYFIITKTISNGLSANVSNPATTVLSNSNMLTTPILSTAEKTPIVFSKPNTFPTGTIIFTNNLPLVQPPTLINSPLILNASPSANTLIMLKNKKKPAPKKKPLPPMKKSDKPIVSQSQPKKLCPKFINTQTTQVNKIPIPSSRYTHSDYILVSKVQASRRSNQVGQSTKIMKRVTQTEKIRVKTKRKAIDKSTHTEPKKNKPNEASNKEIVESEAKKAATSDYSIDAICKDKPQGEIVVSPSIPETKIAETEEKLLPNSNKEEKKAEVAAMEKPEKIQEKMIKPVEVEGEKPVLEITKPLEIATPSIIPDALGHSELSNDIFASLQVPTGGQNPESTSPTAAFLNAFPLVSSFTGVKVTEVMEEETSDSQHGTPTLLQIGTMDTTKPTQSLTDTLTPSLINLDTFSFFSSKEICNNLYNAFDSVVTSTNTMAKMSNTKDINVNTKTAKILYDTAVSETESAKPILDVIKISTAPPIVPCNTIPVVTSNMVTTKVTTQSTSNTITYSVPSTYSQPFYNHSTQVVNATGAQVSANIGTYNLESKSKTEKSSCNRYTSYNISEYNTFNPFTDLPKTSAVCTYSTTKTYTQPTYTNNTNCNYNYQTEFNSNYPKNTTKTDKYYNMNYDNYDNTNQYNYYTPPVKTNKPKVNEATPRPPVNWMTAPDLKQQSTDFVVPSFSKETEFVANIYTQNNTQTTYFNATAPIYSSTDFHNTFTEGKKLDPQFNNTFQRNDVNEEHQFSWSPTKLPQLLDPPHNFVSNTLPTLVGDLALGTTQYLDKNKMKKNLIRSNQQNFDVSTNFLSVSQLVDHNKPETAARITSRRNSGGRSKAVTPKSSKRAKPVENKEPMLAPTYKPPEKNVMKNSFNEEWMGDPKRVKNPPSSYSAEALIGHPTQSQNLPNKQRTQQQNYSKSLTVPTFFPENVIYFPPVDIQQDNNFSQQNQNYQNNSFTHSFSTSIQNNTYSGTFIPNTTTTYLPSTNFIPEITDYNPVIPDNIFSHSNTKINDNKQFNKTQIKPLANKQIFNNTTPKKLKKKPTNETTAPGFVDFSFLSMPGAINSPILPDDFHTHSNFLPPPNPNQLYPCKNPLYPKQGADLAAGLLPLPPVTRGNMQHAEISPSLNNVGTSLTNFNLSTIFPEINKSTVPDMYLDPSKNKDYSLQRSYLPPSSQIPTFAKAPIYSTITTQSFPNN